MRSNEQRRPLMIEMVDMKSDKAVGLVISGKIERADIDRVYERVNEKLAKVDKLSVYVELDQFKGISFDALIEDAKQGIPKLGKIEKKAVVTSAKWLEVFTKVGDKFFPSIEARHFTPEQKEEAMAWVVV
jgi:hypothetical protein